MRKLLLDSLIPATERECVDRLAELRWGRSGPRCVCTATSFRRIQTRPRVWVCRSCTGHKSVTAGTLLHGCHLPVRHWFLASVLLSRPGGCSARELQRRTKVSYESAWQLLHRLRTGVRDPATHLCGRLLLACCNVRTTRPYRDGGRPKGVNFSAVAAILGDLSAVIDHVPTVWSAAHWARALVGVDIPLSRDGPAALSLVQLKRQVKYTHFGVSERWLRHYIAEAQHRENDVGCAFLAASLSATRGRFCDLRPPFEAWPDPYLSSSSST